MRFWKQVLVACATVAATVGVARADRILFSGQGTFRTSNVDGTQVVALPYSQDYKIYPSISRDGSRIVFMAYTHEGGYREGLDVMNADGSGRVRLTPSTFANLNNPSWSPDGSQIAFGGQLPEWAYNSIYVMNADGSNLRHIPNTRGRAPVWSSDGQTLAYLSVSQDGAHGISTTDLQGNHGSYRAIPSFSWGIAWSPDSQWFYFDSDFGNSAYGRREICRISFDGAILQPLTNDNLHDLNPCLSPDGTTVLWASSELRLMNADGSNQRSLASPIVGGEPSWSTAATVPNPPPAPTPTPFPTATSIPTATPSPTATPTPVPNQAPRLVMAAPANGSIARSINEIRGLVLDDTFGERPALRVTLRLQNSAYWNGRAFQAAAFNLATAQSPLPTSPFGSLWRVSSALPTPVQLREGLYLVEATATDKEGLFSRVTGAVRIDLTPPQLALSSVNFNNARSSLSGTWRDAGTVQSVFVQVRRGNGSFWNGRAWQAAPFLLPAALSGTNSTKTGGSFGISANLPPLRELTSGSLLSILAIDRAGNRGGLQQRIGPVPSVPRS